MCVSTGQAREPKCYICAMGNYKPHHVIILSHFQFHSIHYRPGEPGCRWADKQLVSVRITYQKWTQIMYEVEFDILKKIFVLTRFLPKWNLCIAFYRKKKMLKGPTENGKKWTITLYFWPHCQNTSQLESLFTYLF